MSQISELGSSSDCNSPEPGPLGPIATNEAEVLKSCRKKRNSCRTDSGKLHRVQHGLLSREVLAGLVQLGEDPKTLRRLERRYRTALRPTGPLGDLIFDLFWSSYLRLMLSGRLQTVLMENKSAGKRSLAELAMMCPQETLVSEFAERQASELALMRPQETLVSQDVKRQFSEAIPLMEEMPPDLLRDLVLVQRYERPHCRELHRSLALLLLMRRGGEAALEGWASEMLGGCSAT